VFTSTSLSLPLATIFRSSATWARNGAITPILLPSTPPYGVISFSNLHKVKCVYNPNFTYRLTMVHELLSNQTGNIFFIHCCNVVINGRKSSTTVLVGTSMRLASHGGQIEQEFVLPQVTWRQK
jgi:hypothetical protein